MTLAYGHDDVEPFGQLGARQAIRPTLVILCGVIVALATGMLIRSQLYYDSLVNVSRERSIQVGSAMGRVFVTVRGPTPLGSPTDGWTYESGELSGMRDGWPPSIWKTIGVQWGEEQVYSWGNRQVTQWRFRLMWRTLLILFGVPLLIDAYAKRRTHRRLKAERAAEEAAFSGALRP